MRWLLVTVVALVACDAGAPPKPKPTPKPDTPRAAPVVPVVTPPPPRAARHEHVILTADLAKPDLDLAQLPTHGVVLKTWGLGGDDTLVLDSDAGTMRQISNLMGKTHSDRRRIVAPAKVKATMAAAFAAWDEE
ncbi:MAG TPA: hypothetical protein VFQ65_03190, partial [Kofleriaceae bacterium]|nr:hypothetical protein [Kofleriaceae bacterium]